jgi:DUF4097 and DUF4098 domain-containing protein YvlB
MSRREQFLATGPVQLDIEARSGSVEVRAGTSDQVIVTVAGAGAEDWEIAQLGDMITVRPRSGWRSRSSRVLVEAPAGSHADIRTASADVSLAGMLGQTRLRTASGDLRAEAVSELDVSSASGDVRVESIAAGASTAAVSGDVHYGEVVGRVSVTTASGDVRIRHALGDVRIGTTSGDVRVERCDGSEISVKCVSGDVEIGLPAGIRVEPDISTMSGRVRTPAPAATPAAVAAERRVVRLNVRSVSGDVTITRAG